MNKLRGAILGEFLIIAIITLGIITLNSDKIRPSLESAVGSAFTGCTWTPDYWWVTCQSVDGGTKTLVAGAKFTCPDTADTDKCEIVNIESGAGSFNNRECASCGQFFCSGCNPIFKDSIVARGRVIDAWTTISVKIWKKELRSCGAAACTQSGEPLIGAQGCSWKPGQSSIGVGSGLIPIPQDIDLTKLDPIDTVPVGQSFKYVYSQHLLSCPSECRPRIDDLNCAMPTSLRSGQIQYDDGSGQRLVNWYAAGGQLNLVGCKSGQQACEIYNDDRTQCLKWKTLGECGTISVRSSGQCVQNSDCGDTTRYYCDWDSTILQGTCRLKTPDVVQECQFDYQCTQTAPTCNARQYGAQRCIGGKCVLDAKPVECCNSNDCASGFFCNSQFKCEESQKQLSDCPLGECCESRNPYRDRTCTAMTGGKKTVCCSSSTQNKYSCVSAESECGIVEDESKGCGLNIFCHIGNVVKGIYQGIVTLGLIVVAILLIVLFIFIAKR